MPDIRRTTDPAAPIKRLMLYKKMLAAPYPDLIGQNIHRAHPGTNVYLMSCKETDSGTMYMKIGVASDVAKRMKGIHTDNPLEIRRAIYFCFDFSDEAYRIEGELHRLESANHHRGEWFRYASKSDLSEAVERIGDYVETIQGSEFMQFIFDCTVEKYDNRVIANGRYFGRIWSEIEEKIDFA